MDTLPHNGAVITLLAVTGLTHRQSYKDIFAITCIKTLAVFVVIGVLRDRPRLSCGAALMNADRLASCAILFMTGLVTGCTSGPTAQHPMPPRGRARYSSARRSASRSTARATTC